METATKRITERADGTAVYTDNFARVALVIDHFTGMYQVITSRRVDVHSVRHEVDPVSGRVLQTWTTIDHEWRTEDMSADHEELAVARAEFDDAVAAAMADDEAVTYPLPAPRPAHETRRKAEAHDGLVAELERTRAELATHRLAARHATTPGAQL